MLDHRGQTSEYLIECSDSIDLRNTVQLIVFSDDLDGLHFMFLQSLDDLRRTVIVRHATVRNNITKFSICRDTVYIVIVGDATMDK